MKKILQNNYIPLYETRVINGYAAHCPFCQSVIFFQKTDFDWADASTQDMTCPACGHTFYKEEWMKHAEKSAITEKVKIQ